MEGQLKGGGTTQNYFSGLALAISPSCPKQPPLPCFNLRAKLKNNLDSHNNPLQHHLQPSAEPCFLDNTPHPRDLRCTSPPYFIVNTIL